MYKFYVLFCVLDYSVLCSRFRMAKLTCDTFVRIQKSGKAGELVESKPGELRVLRDYDPRSLMKKKTVVQRYFEIGDEVGDLPFKRSVRGESVSCQRVQLFETDVKGERLNGKPGIFVPDAFLKHTVHTPPPDAPGAGNTPYLLTSAHRPTHIFVLYAFADTGEKLRALMPSQQKSAPEDSLPQSTAAICATVLPFGKAAPPRATVPNYLPTFSQHDPEPNAESSTTSTSHTPKPPKKKRQRTPKASANGKAKPTKSAVGPGPVKPPSFSDDDDSDEEPLQRKPKQKRAPSNNRRCVLCCPRPCVPTLTLVIVQNRE